MAAPPTVGTAYRNWPRQDGGGIALCSSRAQPLLPCRWPAAVPDITVQLPLSRLLFPDDHILARVEHLIRCPLQSIGADFIGRVTASFYFEGVELDRLDPHVHGPLPERLDRQRAADHSAVGGQHLRVCSIDERCTHRITATECHHKLFDR